MQGSDKNIEYCKAITASTRKTYNAVGSVYCPALQKNVVFNAKGFHHLLYKPGGTPRTVSERIHKLTLFPLAVPVVKNATTIVDERDVTVAASRKKGAKRKKGKTYALVAKVGRKSPLNVRVIVMRIGNGSHIFWSIMKD